MTCEEITKITMGEIEATGSKKYWYKFHHLICECCVNFSKQVNVISIESKKVQPELSEEQKDRIRQCKQDVLSKYTKQ